MDLKADVNIDKDKREFYDNVSVLILKRRM